MAWDGAAGPESDSVAFVILMTHFFLARRSAKLLHRAKFDILKIMFCQRAVIGSFGFRSLRMERAAIWIFAGLLAYMCFVLTLINYKIDRNNPTNIQVAALSDSARAGAVASSMEHVVMLHQAQPTLSPVHAGLGLIALASIFASWHLSRIYYTHEWTKMVLRKNFAPFAEPYVKPVTPSALHIDQECVGDPPAPDGRIKDSWLPRDLTRLDLSFDEPQPEVAPLRSRSGLA